MKFCSSAYSLIVAYFIPDTNYVIKEEPGTYTLCKNPSKIKESKLKKPSTKESKTKNKGRLKRTAKTIKRRNDTNNKLDIELNVKIENNGESCQSGDGGDTLELEGEENCDGGSKQVCEGKPEKGYVCEMCNEVFPHRHMFYRHMKKGHGIEG